jgi:outer membrane protein assembly factor BamB
VNIPRIALAGPLLLVLALLAASCGGIANPQGWAEPAIDGDTAYIFRAKDKLSAVEVRPDGSSSILWTFPNRDISNQKDIKLEAVYGQPVLDGDRLYIGAHKGEIYAIRARDGDLIWAADDFHGSIVGGPTLADGRLFFGTTEGRVYALNAEDGRRAPGWPADGVRFDKGVWAAPAASGDRLFIATMGGELHALSLADGTSIWPEPFKISAAIADITLLDEDRLFVPSLNKQVYIVNTSDGRAPGESFRAEHWVWTAAAFKDNIVYFGDFAGKVYALDITTMRTKWTFETEAKVKSGPAIVQDALVVADREPIVYMLRLASGELINRVPLVEAGTVRANVAPMDDKALIVTTRGKLFRADPKNRVVPDIQLGGN